MHVYAKYKRECTPRGTSHNPYPILTTAISHRRYATTRTSKVIFPLHHGNDQPIWNRNLSDFSPPSDRPIRLQVIALVEIMRLGQQKMNKKTLVAVVTQDALTQTRCNNILLIWSQKYYKKQKVENKNKTKQFLLLSGFFGQQNVFWIARISRAAYLYHHG